MDKDNIRYNELIETVKKVIFDNVKGEISPVEHQGLLVNILKSIGEDIDNVYTIDDIEKLLKEKVDVDAYEEYVDSQLKVNNRCKVDINNNSQNINHLNEVIKLLSQKDKPTMTAKGGDVISLPENAMRSVAPKYKFGGLTVQNLVKNGDFSNGTIGWVGDSDKEIKDGWLFESNPTAQTVALFAKNTFIANKDDIFYTSFEIKNSEIIESIRILIRQPEYKEYNSGETVYDIKDNKYSSLVKISKDLGKVQTFRKLTYKKEDINNTNETRNYITINLTQTFGAGNEPTKEWCDEHINGYFEGVKSVQLPMRIKSVGENLLDVFNAHNDGRYWVLKDKPLKAGELICIANNSIYFSAGLDVYLVKGCTYNILFNSEVVGSKKHPFMVINRKGNVRYYNKSTYTANYSGNHTLHFTYTTEGGNNGNYKDDYVRFYNLYIGVGREYIKYNDSVSFINSEATLKSALQVKDYIEDGKLYKNIKRHYFTSKDKWTLREEYEGDNFRYSMDLPFEYKSTGADVEGELICNNFTPAPNVGGVTTKRESNTIALYKENATIVYLTLDKKVDDVNSVIPEGTFIDVILPETEVSNLNTSGLITNHPNGTIFIEPITNVTAYYNDGLDVSNFNIESVEEFTIFKDGNYQNLDVSKIKITDNKLTHPDAINGLCYLVYRYDNNPIIGDNEVEYYNNDGILVSPDGTFWKPVLTVDDEGNILMKGEKL